MIRRLSASILCTMLSIGAIAQDSGAVAASGPQDFMHSGGKIGVVMTVCLTILIGLILFLVRLDRKISRLEKK